MWLWAALAFAGKPEISQLVPSADGAWVAALGTRDGKGWVAVYDTATGEAKGDTVLALPAAPLSAGFSKDGTQVVVFGDEAAIAVGTTTFEPAATVPLEVTPRMVCEVGPWKLRGAGLNRKLLLFDVAERKASYTPVTEPGMQAVDLAIDASGHAWIAIEDERGMNKRLCRLEGSTCDTTTSIVGSVIGLHPRGEGVGGLRPSSAAECALVVFRVNGGAIAEDIGATVTGCPTFSSGPTGAWLTHTSTTVRVQTLEADAVEAVPSGLSGVRDAVIAGVRVAVTDGKKVAFYDFDLRR